MQVEPIASKKADKSEKGKKKTKKSRTSEKGAGKKKVEAETRSDGSDLEGDADKHVAAADEDLSNNKSDAEMADQEMVPAEESAQDEQPPAIHRTKTTRNPEDVSGAMQDVVAPPPPPPANDDPQHMRMEMKRKMASALGNPDANPGETIERAESANRRDMSFPNFVLKVIDAEADNRDASKVHLTGFIMKVETRQSPIVYTANYKGALQPDKCWLQAVYADNDPDRPKPAKKGRADMQERFPRYIVGQSVFLDIGRMGVLKISYKKSSDAEQLPTAGQSVRLHNVEPKVSGGRGKDGVWKALGDIIYLNVRTVEVLPSALGRPLAPFEVASNLIDAASFDPTITAHLAGAYVKSFGGVPDLPESNGPMKMGTVVRTELADANRAACEQFAEKLRANAKHLDAILPETGEPITQRDREDAKNSMLALAAQLDSALAPEDVLPQSKNTKDGTPYAIVHRGDTDLELGLDPRIVAMIDGESHPMFKRVPNTFVVASEPYMPEINKKANEKMDTVMIVDVRSIHVPNKGHAIAGYNKSDETGVIRSRPTMAENDVASHRFVVGLSTVGRIMGTMSAPHGVKLVPKALGPNSSFIAARTSVPKDERGNYLDYAGFKNRSSAATIEPLDRHFSDKLIIDVPATLMGIGVRVTEKLMFTLANENREFVTDREFFSENDAELPIVGTPPEKATFRKKGWVNLWETDISASQLKSAVNDPKWAVAGDLCYVIVDLDDAISAHDKADSWRDPAHGDKLVNELTASSAEALKAQIKALKFLPYAVMVPKSLIAK